MTDFFNLNNSFFWLSLAVALYYGAFALRIGPLGGNQKLNKVDEWYQRIINFIGGFASGFLLWLVFDHNYFGQSLLAFLILLVLSLVSLFGYLPHFIINILLRSDSLVKLFRRLISRQL